MSREPGFQPAAHAQPCRPKPNDDDILQFFREARLAMTRPRRGPRPRCQARQAPGFAVRRPAAIRYTRRSLQVHSKDFSQHIETGVEGCELEIAVNRPVGTTPSRKHRHIYSCDASIEQE